MRILVDENIPLMTVRALREMGHDVCDVRGTEEMGSNDDELFAHAYHERRLLITTDKGFAQRRHDAHAGILIIRLRKPNRQKIHERVMLALSQIQPDDWPGLLVVMRDAIRSMSRG